MFHSTRKEYCPFSCFPHSSIKVVCISFPSGYQVSPDLFPAAGHWHPATQQLLSQCPKAVALLQTPPGAFTTAYTPTPVKRKDSEQLSKNYFNCYIASNAKLQNTIKGQPYGLLGLLGTEHPAYQRWRPHIKTAYLKLHAQPYPLRNISESLSGYSRKKESHSDQQSPICHPPSVLPGQLTGE